MRHGSFDYELDEFQPIKDVSMYVYGNAIVDWEYDTPDRDVGETCGYSFSICDIYISSSKSDGKAYQVPQSGALYQMIYERLMREDDYILAAVKRDDAS